MARVITFGNEKGGAGKSTLAMHVVIGLLYRNYRVGVMDFDLRQLSLKRFLENRAAYMQRHALTVPSAEYFDIANANPTIDSTELDRCFDRALDQLRAQNDVIVIDCPGALTPLSKRAHEAADILLTPLNDSFIDFDLLARLDATGEKIDKPSIYAEMVWDARKARHLGGGKPIDWIVARNRLSALNMHNKRKVGEALQNLAKRIGFRMIPGLSDRVIFKELFPVGLTLFDAKLSRDIPMKMSNVAARQELRDLINDLNLPPAPT